LKSWKPDTPSQEIAREVGRELVLDRPDTIDRLVPKQRSGPNNYSGIYGLGEFPLHTDLAHWREPPRYLMLRCIRGYSSITTTVVDGMAVVKEVGASLLGRTLLKPRRPIKGEVPLFPLFRPAYGGRHPILRWDEVFIVPASSAGHTGSKLFKSAISSAPETTISLENPGDTLWLDNWRMLHGRSAIKDDQVDRIIERAYFGEFY
jgi:L-asparagine oxygenase